MHAKGRVSLVRAHLLRAYLYSSKGQPLIKINVIISVQCWRSAILEEAKGKGP